MWEGLLGERCRGRKAMLCVWERGDKGDSSTDWFLSSFLILVFSRFILGQRRKPNCLRSRSPVASTFQSKLKSFKFVKIQVELLFTRFCCESRYEDIPVRLEGEQKVAPLQSFKEVTQTNKNKQKQTNTNKQTKPPKIATFQVELAAQIASNVERVGYTSFTPVQKWADHILNVWLVCFEPQFLNHPKFANSYNGTQSEGMHCQ